MQCDSGKCEIKHRRLLKLTTKNDKQAGFVGWSTGVPASFRYNSVIYIGGLKVILLNICLTFTEKCYDLLKIAHYQGVDKK